MPSTNVTSPQEEKIRGPPDTHMHAYFEWPWVRRSTRTDFLFCPIQEKIATIAGKFDSDNRCQNIHSGFSLTVITVRQIWCFQTGGNPSESKLLVIPKTLSLCECMCQEDKSQVMSRSVSCLLNRKEPWCAARHTFAFQMYANLNRFVAALIDELPCL